MARQHLEAGGAAVAPGGAAVAPGGAAVAPGGAAGAEGWPVPADIDLAAIDAAIAARLAGAGGAGRGRPSALHIDNDGKVLVPADYVRRLGDGDFGQGKRWLERAIADIRTHRVLTATRRG